MACDILPFLKRYFGREMFRKIKKFWSILKYFFQDEDLLFLYLLRVKAEECMKDCYRLNVGSTEELEDLIFHINTYIDTPKALIETKYSYFEDTSVQDIISRFKKDKISLKEIEEYGDFLVDIEMHRALERDLIFDHAKNLPFGFSL